MHQPDIDGERRLLVDKSRYQPTLSKTINKRTLSPTDSAVNQY